MFKNNVYTIIVAYQPDIDLLKKCIDSIQLQTTNTIIIDNSPSKYIELEKFRNTKIDILYLEENMGIAYAQNIGIKKAIEKNADFILTSDQDTIYPNNYIKSLLKCYLSISKNIKIASISPIYTDENKEGSLQPMVYFQNGFLYKDYSLEKCKAVSHVISSGMLIPSNVLNDIGLMDKNLFIDWVDTEWCWRAISKGYSIIQTPNVKISHCLGNPSKKMINKNITVHSSFRNYYKIRNAVYLFFYNNSLNMTMKFFILQQIFKMIIIHPLTSNKKIQEIKIMFNGIKDGIFAKMNKGTR